VQVTDPEHRPGPTAERIATIRRSCDLTLPPRNYPRNLFPPLRSHARSTVLLNRSLFFYPMYGLCGLLEYFFRPSFFFSRFVMKAPFSSGRKFMHPKSRAFHPPINSRRFQKIIEAFPNEFLYSPRIFPLPPLSLYAREDPFERRYNNLSCSPTALTERSFVPELRGPAPASPIAFSFFLSSFLLEPKRFCRFSPPCQLSLPFLYDTLFLPSCHFLFYPPNLDGGDLDHFRPSQYPST